MVLLEHIFTFIDKILPLLSTLLGAYITYYVTVLSKRNELKIQAQAEARDKYWIPCSLAISNLQNKISEMCKTNDCYVSFYGKDSCELEITDVLNYLQADKRMFFRERTRNLLETLSKNISDYETAIDCDVHSLISDFRKHYYTMLKEFSVYKINNCTDCSITVKRELSEEIKEALLTHKGIVWHGQIINVDFIRGDYNLSNSFSTNMSYPNEDFYFDVWYQINEGYKQRHDFCLDGDQELGLDVLDYEHKHFSKYANELNQILESKNYQPLYTQIFETLDLLQAELFSNIDQTIVL